MKKTKILKIIVTILIVITLLIAFTQSSFATHVDIDNLTSRRDKGNATNEVAIVLSKTINIIQVVGAGFAIIMLVVLGIRWVYNSQDPSYKSKLKKQATYYIMGAIFIFAAIGLLQIVKAFTVVNIKNQV